MISKYFVLVCALVQGLVVTASEGSNLRSSGNKLNKSNDGIEQRASSKEMRKIAAKVATYPLCYGFPGGSGASYYHQNSNPLDDMKPYLPYHLDFPSGQ